MGGAYKDEFTPEELAALEGEGPKTEPDEPKEPENPEEPKVEEPKEPVPEEPKAEEPKDEPSEEVKAAESMGLKVETDDKGKIFIVDDEGTRIPVTRWKKFYAEQKAGVETAQREAQTIKEKHDLLRTRPDEYYRRYPEEAPQRQEPIPQQVTREQLDNLPISGGEYNGWTLAQVWEVNPKEASRMENEYLRRVEKAQERQRQEVEAKENERKSDVQSFGMARAKELWGITDPKALTPAQHKELIAIGNRVLDWQYANGRQHYSMGDAWDLMTVNERIAKAKEEASKTTLKSLTEKKGIASIDTAGGAPVKDNTFAAMEKWTDDQLERHIDRLSEPEYVKFRKEAPAKILMRLGL